jgi:hypothetical protein
MIRDNMVGYEAPLPPNKWKRGGGREKRIVKLDVKKKWDISTNAYPLMSYTTTTLLSDFFHFLYVYEILLILCCFDA